MEFVNRKKEIEEMERMYGLSKKKVFPILITGLRRIGKTRLIKEFMKNKEGLYFFVYESKTEESLLEEFTEELRNKGFIDEFTRFRDMKEFLDFLFKKLSGCVVVFDEVQYMKSINPSFFSYMQRKIDENEDSKNMIIFCGSIMGLIKDIFENNKSALYGRIKNTISLKPLLFKDVREMLKQVGYKDLESQIEFYSVFGGFPKYYVTMEDFRMNKGVFETIKDLFLSENAPLKDEVKNVLMQEFGKGKRNYYSILEAIAQGRTRLVDIANKMGKTSTDISPFMDDLLYWYELIGREVPITEDKKTKKTIYYIKSPVIKFWFKFIYPNMRYVELNQYDAIEKKVKDGLSQFVGLRFEDVVKELMKDIYPDYSLVGKWWGYKREEGRRVEMEIDVVGLNEDKKEILFGECKWKDNVDAEKVFEELREKAKYVKWNVGNRKEKYVIFAKSFKNREVEGVELVDLKDIEVKIKK